ncbi:DegT/DnrJ/EryC1/StrS family aminotransferase [Prochlorococcus sp. MIT 1341]|uniref:DegT/DnrJ/EryC1/StrS family aminotransferase n=1 Tax=Prochlorococcus sp. MIT 1341 TaxID=3096221 RepID=UPI002A76675E|nr:DegT/DnrJ/EryC1/StrS family aminotransferase [Prochlorococcus sp. MIT 1341]
MIISLVNENGCKRASEKTKSKSKEAIKRLYGDVDVALFPYARTSFYACLSSLNLEVGTEILITPLTIPPMLNIIYSLGLKPLFVDIELQYFNVCTKDLKAKINSNKPACILLTYLFGIVPNIDEIVGICNEAGIVIFEDISQAIGAEFNGIPLGMHGKAGFYSSSITKYVDSYNGSFIISKDRRFVDKLNKLSSTLISPDSWRIRKIILKTLIWNIALNKHIFKFITYDLLNIIRRLNKELFDNLLGPTTGFKLYKNLPNFYFEDISKVQCEKMIIYLEKLECLISERRKMAEKAVKAYKGRKVSMPIGGNSLNTKDTFWQFIIPVESRNLAQETLFKNGCETGTSNLYNIAKESNEKLSGPDAVKNSHIFIPLHKHLDTGDYDKIFRQLEKMGQLK